MTHRQRVLAALAHHQPDRLPCDLGGALATTITENAYQRLCAHLDIVAPGPPSPFSRRASTVIPDQRVLEHFDVDCRPALLGDPDGSPDRPCGDGSFLDEWGVRWSRPVGGHYIPVEGPFSKLDEPDPASLASRRWPDPSDPGRYRGLADRTRLLHETTDYAVVLNLAVGPVHVSQFLRGYGEWLVDLIERPAFVEALLDLTANFWIDVAERALTEAAPYVDVVCFGDDIATQKGPLMRPELYRRLIKPIHRRMIEAVKRFSRPVLYHSCGAVYPLIPDLLEIGIDALNPVQVSAASMDTVRLKREFGDDLAFWGGVDTQRVLSRGTPADVRAEVRRRVQDLAGDGGYVLAAVHNLQEDVPPENIIAMFDAAREFGAS